jgi:hypothetical protein
MQSLALHPALWQLLKFQARGKYRKLLANFSSPRRQLLSVLAVVLAVVWLGNAVASMVLRDSYDPVAFERWMSRSLLLYFFWHLVRVAYSRPETAQEWSLSEQTFLCGGPFSRRELLTYRLMGIFSATLPKASLVAFVLWPDLPMIGTGFLGLLLGLVFLEYLRLILETLVCGMSGRGFSMYRVLVFGALVAVVGFGLSQAVSVGTLDGKNHWRFLSTWAGAIGALNNSVIGQLLEAPFRVFANVIMAQGVSWELASVLGGAMALVAAAAHFSIRWDSVSFAKTQEAELCSSSEDRRERGTSLSAGWPRIFHLGGLGTVAWRQWHFARRHWGSLSVGLGVPAVLASLPLLVPGDGLATYLTVFGGVVFYSFVLLPAALKLDFRRDFDHLALLKSLPMKPLTIVLGQLTAPAALTCGFQVAVLSLAAAICRVPWDVLMNSLVFLLPVSVCFTALDNLIFLLYPHRLHQEGLEVFLRSTLTFTGKGILLVGALLGVIGWLQGARLLTDAFASQEWYRWIFVSGLAVFAAAFAAVAVMLSVWAFSRLDPAEI